MSMVQWVWCRVCVVQGQRGAGCRASVVQCGVRRVHCRASIGAVSVVVEETLMLW